MLVKWAAEVLATVDASISRTPSGSRKIAVARTVIALAQLTTLIFSVWDSFFVPIGDGGFAPDCDGVSQVGAYCLLWSINGSYLPTFIMIIGLLIVLSGFLPRASGLLHVWLTISFSSSINLPDGGESVAQIVVLLLAFVSLSDSRWNHWQESVFVPGVAAPLSWAAAHVIRFQLAWIYFNAAVTKTAVPEWQDGTAVYYMTMDPMFGTAGPLGWFFDWIAYSSFGALGMAWGAIVIEMSIAILLIGPAKFRVFAFWLAILMHVLFIVMIGLWSFSLIMIASVLVATGPSVSLQKLSGGMLHTGRKSSHRSSTQEMQGA